MQGVYRFLSFLAIYYVFVSLIDIYGTIKSYKNKSQEIEIVEENMAFDFDFNTDFLMVCLIYLASYYFGVFL